MKNTQEQKPVTLRIIFILNAIMGILPFIFYYVFSSRDISIGNLDPIWMVYTGIAYVVSFVFLVRFILKRNLLGAKAIFIINIGIALPASAYIGIAVALTSLTLSFLNKPVKDYFSFQAI